MLEMQELVVVLVMLVQEIPVTLAAAVEEVEGGREHDCLVLMLGEVGNLLL